MEQKLERLKGQIERITFTSEESGYTVARVRVYDRNDLVTVVGCFANLSPGEVVQMSGQWTSHPKFGEQFKVAFYHCETPATVKGIERYLGSGLIKGIGPKMAKRIVALFGEKTLDIIEQTPEALEQVEGIGKNRVEMIRTAWSEQKDIRDVMLFLQSHGVSSTYATKIYKVYGKNAIQTVQENPYRLAYDIYGIGFKTADKIATALGFATDSPLRAEAGILYVLHTCVEDGHVFYPRPLLLEKASTLLAIEKANVLEEAVDRLTWDNRLVIEDRLFESQTVHAVYLAGFHRAEVQVAARITTLCMCESALRAVDVPRAITWAEGQTGMILAAKQRDAVCAALTKKIVIITGGPGTGKSTLLSVILQIYSKISSKILLTAPTGRAAKRMAEVTGLEAKTIHRLLCYDFKKRAFKKNEDDPLDCDLLILDEVSMVDLLLFHYLVKAIPRSAKVILVGDINQLPSVGAGCVLHDLIGSGAIPVVRLTEIFRQAQQSSIISNAHAIINGRMVQFPNRETDDMFFIEEEDPEQILETIIGLAKTRLPRKYHVDPLRDIQVLSPMNRGVVGTQRLNEALQNALNANTLQISRGTRIFRLGDKVMQIQNNYDKEVFNGDIGIISKINTEEQTVTVTVDGRDLTYDYHDLDELVLAYAISIHKSQGGEYPVVIMPLSTQHYVMLQRNLIYTGITRGKKLVVLVGTRKALSIAIRNIKQMKRYSALAERLRLLAQTKSSLV
ncbi:MAG: ATP-dependent RecD-like DNA helicase [Desulfovibrionaceae bacterium]|nr:ATP-dependent RecD-like DNA helicase [Desulfovibrionaceae bacterium]